VKALIYIHIENEEFWVNLENKSGWVNMVIETIKEADRKEKELYGEVEYDPTASIQDPFKDLPENERPIY
jgi:hypothetical protein